MDSTAFDGLTRVLASDTTRRNMTRVLGGFVLGILALGPLPGDAKKGGKKRKKKSKKRGGNEQDTNTNTPQSPSSPPPPPPPSPTCSDGITNGGETDVDCGGGTCPRCAAGKTCANRNDCTTALCTGGTCQQCVAASDCGTDSDGSMCACRDSAAGTRICTKLNGRFIAGGTCADCVAGEQCTLPPGGAECLFSCGA